MSLDTVADRSDAPATVETDVVGGAADAVLFTFGSGRYSLSMACVAEVAMVPALTVLPRMPAWVLGVANWRGRVLPVLDLRPLLGLRPHALASSARIVVIAEGGAEVAIVAESVPGVVEADVELQPAPEGGSDLLRGITTDAAGPIAVVDPTSVLQLSRRLPAA